MHASAPFVTGAGRFHTRLALGAVLALTLITLAALWPAAARAADPLDFSAGDQYVETLPTAKGPKVTENAPKRRAGSGLSKQVKKQLAADGGGQADTLAYVAEAPELGAPAPTGSSSSSSSSDDGGSKKGKKKGGDAKSSTSVPSAAINAAGGSGSGLGWLALALPLITAVALGAFGFQQRRNRDAG
jgi:hypothetical protein